MPANILETEVTGISGSTAIDLIISGIPYHTKEGSAFNIAKQVNVIYSRFCIAESTIFMIVNQIKYNSHEAVIRRSLVRGCSDANVLGSPTIAAMCLKGIFCRMGNQQEGMGYDRHLKQ